MNRTIVLFLLWMASLLVVLWPVSADCLFCGEKVGWTPFAATWIGDFTRYTERCHKACWMEANPPPPAPRRGE